MNFWQYTHNFLILFQTFQRMPPTMLTELVVVGEVDALVWSST